MIIGLSGTFASGKDIVADYLNDHGFEHVSSADVLRQEVEKRGLEINRDTLRATANDLVERYEGQYLAQQALATTKGKNVVISAIRRQGEIDYLKKQGDFKLIFVDAPLPLRYQRMKDRAREGESLISLDELKIKEAEEFSGQNSQRLDYCKMHADTFIDNSGTLEDLYEQIDSIIR